MAIRSYQGPNTPPKVIGDVANQANAQDLIDIRARLVDVQGFLAPWAKLTGLSDGAKAYLPEQAGGNKELFLKSVKWVRHCVDQYLDVNSNWYLNVAIGNVQGALASAIPLAKLDNLSPGDSSTAARHTTFLIQPAFTLPYHVGNQRKQLTDHGRATSLLHELTHSTMGTKDVYAVPGDNLRPYAVVADGMKPGDNWADVLTPTDCQTLAQGRTSFKPANANSQMPYAWMNAENWTRALMTGLYFGANAEPVEFNLV